MSSKQEADDHTSPAVDTATADAGDDLKEEKKKYLQEDDEDNIDVRRNKNTWYAAPTLWQNKNSTSHHNDNDDEWEWEHLFLDLFYVPAISNLSELLASVVGYPDVTQEQVDAWNYYEYYSIRGDALLCFIAVFFAIWYSWYHQCVYESKFIARDTFHRVLNRGRLIFVAVSIYQISEYDELVGEDEQNELSFYFCLGITLECIISLLLRVEAIIMTRDDDGVVMKDSIVTVTSEFCPRLAFYIAAWIAHNRSEQWPWLVLCGALVPSIFLMLVQHFKHSSMIPMSRHVYISRIGSWVSIIIGEGIISLLNPGDIRRDDDLISGVLGIVTLTIVHSIYFSNHGQISASEKFRGRLQTALIELLSLAFIGIGVASKQGANTQNTLLKMRDLAELQFFNATMPERPSDFMYYYITEYQYVVIDEPNDFKASANVERSENTYPMVLRMYANLAFFFCLPALLFFLEAIFWTSNPAYVAKIRGLFRGQDGGKGKGKMTLVVSILVLQLAALLAVAVTGIVNDGMMSLEQVYRHIIGFVLSAAFLLSRIIVVSALK